MYTKQIKLLSSRLSCLALTFFSIASSYAQSYNVKTFGALGNGTQDDRAFIQNAIDKAYADGGGEVYFPNGTYKVSLNPEMATYKTCVIVYKNISLRGESQTGTVIKIADNLGNFDAIIGANPGYADLSNLKISNLTVHGNGVKNDIAAESDFENAMRYGVRIYTANKVLIENCHFTDMINVNTITCNSSTSCKNVVIRNNRFTLQGAIGADYDHSTIYTNCDSAIVDNNTFQSRYGAGTKGVRAAIEIHGARQYVYNNKIDGFWIGINVTANAKINSYRQRYFNNTMVEVGTGFLVWSDFSAGNTNPILKDIMIFKNSVSVNVDGWRGYYNGIPRGGIAFEPNRDGDIEDLFIVDNTVKFLNASAAKAISYDYFAGLVSVIKYLNVNAKITNLNIINNSVTDAPGSGILLQSVVDGGAINGNRLVRCGRSAYNIGDRYRCGVKIDNYAVGNYSVACNRFSDDQATKSLKYGISEESISQGNNHYFGNILDGVNVPEFFQGTRHEGQTWSTSPISKISLEKDTVYITGNAGSISAKLLRSTGSNTSSVLYKLMVAKGDSRYDFVIANGKADFASSELTKTININIPAQFADVNNSFALVLHTPTNAKIDCIQSNVIKFGTVTSLNNEGNDVSKEITVYPNPAQSELFIESASDNISYEITSIEGKSMDTGSLNGQNISVQHLSPGTYLLKIKTELAETVHRFVKE